MKLIGTSQNIQSLRIYPNYYNFFFTLQSVRMSTTHINFDDKKIKHKGAATLISNHKLQNNCSLKKYISEHKCKNYVNLCEFM